MGIHDINDILQRHGVTADQFEKIKQNQRFLTILDSEVADWNSAVNSNERVKIKSAVLIEEWLPELNARLHDTKESLDAKVKAGTLVARLAGMGLTGAVGGEDGAQRFSVTINLGPQKLTFDKELAPKTIEGVVNAD